jgi:hypothetical protein
MIAEIRFRFSVTVFGPLKHNSSHIASLDVVSKYDGDQFVRRIGGVSKLSNVDEHFLLYFESRLL